MSRPTLGRQDTAQVLSYYFHDSNEEEEAAPPTRRPAALAPPTNRRLAIVELDGKEQGIPRRFDRSRLALVAPPDTAPPAREGSASTSADEASVSLAPLAVFQPYHDATPLLTPAIGESKQIGTKVAAPVMTRLGSQDTWLPPSPTKPATPPVGPRGAPPPRPPRLHSPPLRNSPRDDSPAPSLHDLASLDSAKLTVRNPMARANSEFTIFALSDNSNSERNTPRDELSEPTSPTKPPADPASSHRREGAFPAHSVLASRGQTQHADGLPQSSVSDDRAFYLGGRRPVHAIMKLGQDDDGDDQDPDRTDHARKNTITSRSSRTQTASSSVSHYTHSSGSNYTSSNTSRKHTQDPFKADETATDDMEELIATVGTALADLGMDPADVPPSTVFPPPDESKPSRSGSLDGHGSRSSPLGSTSNLTQPYTDIPRGSPRMNVSDIMRGSPGTGTVEFPRTEARDAPRPSAVDVSRSSSRPSTKTDTRPKGLRGSRSGSPVSWARDSSPDKQTRRNGNAQSDRPRAREAKTFPDGQTRDTRSPDRGSIPQITRSSYEQISPTSASTGSQSFPSPQTPLSALPQHNARMIPRPQSSNSLAHGARLSPLRNTIDRPRFRERSAPMPESWMFDDVLRMKTSAERAQGYIRKINQLAHEDSGLGYWVAFMKGRVRHDPQTPSTGPISPGHLNSTFGPRGPGSRQHLPQPRHVSGGSTTSEATFAVRPDAYVATNISIRAESPPIGPPPSLPYPSLARDIGVRSVPSSPSATTLATTGIRAKAGAVGFFSTIGRKASTRKDRDRLVMQQARKPNPTGGYAELPPARPVQLSTVPTIPGGPRARGQKSRRDVGSVMEQMTGTSSASSLQARSSVIMSGGRDSFHSVSHDGHGRPVSVRVSSSNGHGAIVPASASPSPSFGSSPTERSEMRSPDARSSFRSAEGASIYSGRESLLERESISMHGVRGSGAPGQGGTLDQLADVLPHVDRSVLAGYLERAGGHEIDAISAYLEDERRANAAAAGFSTGVGLSNVNMSRYS